MWKGLGTALTRSSHFQLLTFDSNVTAYHVLVIPITELFLCQLGLWNIYQQFYHIVTKAQTGPEDFSNATFLIYAFRKIKWKTKLPRGFSAGHPILCRGPAREQRRAHRHGFKKQAINKQNRLKLYPFLLPCLLGLPNLEGRVWI